MYIRKYVKIQVNGDTYYILEDLIIEDEEPYLVNRIQDEKLRHIIRHYIDYLEKRVIPKESD